MPEENELAQVEEEQVLDAEQAEEDVSDSDEDAEEPAQAEKAVQDGVQRRIDKLTRQKRDMEREAAFWKQKALDLEPPKKAVAEAPVTLKPAPDDYVDHAQYVEDLAAYKAEQIVEQKLKARDQQRVQSKEAEHNQAAQTRWANQVEIAQDKYDDFDDVVYSNSTHITPAMAEAIMDSDVGTEVAYFLGKNPEVARRIASLSPLAAAKEIGKIEAKLDDPKEANVKVSSAPAPIKPVSATKTSFKKDPSQMSDAEFNAYRRAQMAARGRT